MTHPCPLRCGRMIDGHVCPECLRALRLEVYGRNVYRLAFGKHKSRRTNANEEQGQHKQQDGDAILEAKGLGPSDGRGDGQEPRQWASEEGEGHNGMGKGPDASGRL